ncbi:Chaperone protein DnaJ [ANME-1 cluster archaeon GoMg1]|nr:Chaperone protein DnaJ [ANME-1 cluster archaeon GoMg1]
MAEEKKAYDDWMQLHVCDDPYWKVPTRYMDRSRVGGQERKLDKFDRLYPGCVDDLYKGLPTYYGGLCVSKNDSQDAIEKAYERKKKSSIYPEEVIERAYEMLSDKGKRSAYDEIIRVFTKVLLAFTASEKREIIEGHADWLEREKKRDTMEYIMENRGAWFYLFSRGAPTFYKLLGVDRAKLKEGEEVKCKKKNVDPRLAEEICKTLNNLQLRFEYDFVFDELSRFFDANPFADELLQGLLSRGASHRRKKAFLKGRDAAYLMVLKYQNYLKRYGEIMDDHLDWQEYTGDKTFYSVLNIDASLIPADKREAESFIRNAYRDKERTEEVNLAYSVLKNSRLREDYDWLLKHGKWLSKMHKLDMEKAGKAQINAVMEMADAAVMDVQESLARK